MHCFYCNYQPIPGDVFLSQLDDDSQVVHFCGPCLRKKRPRAAAQVGTYFSWSKQEDNQHA